MSISGVRAVSMDRKILETLAFIKSFTLKKTTGGHSNYSESYDECDRQIARTFSIWIELCCGSGWFIRLSTLRLLIDLKKYALTYKNVTVLEKSGKELSGAVKLIFV